MLGYEDVPEESLVQPKVTTETSKKHQTSNQEEQSQLLIKYNLSFPLNNLKLFAPHKGRKNADKTVDGYILLTLPSGKFPVEIYQSQGKLLEDTESFLGKWLLSNNLFSEVNPAESLHLERYPIRHSFFIGAPLLLKSPIKFRIFLKFAVCQWMINDFIEKSTSSAHCVPFLSLEFFIDLAKIVTNIMSGLYRHVDAVPYFEIPLVYHCLVALFHVQKELEENVGKTRYERYHKHLLQEMMDWIEAHRIAIFNLSGNGGTGRPHLGVMDRTFFECRRYLNGRGALLEIIQLLSECSLEDPIRRRRLFKMFCDTGILAHNLALDTFVMKRSWNIGQDSGGQRDFLSRTRSHYLTSDLGEVFETAQEVINDAIVDFRRMADCLLSDYRRSEKVRNFVMNLQVFVDGGIRAAMEDWRCGKRGRCQVLKMKKNIY